MWSCQAISLTCLFQCWTGIIYFDTLWGIITGISHFDSIFVFNTIRIYAMEGPTYLSQIALAQSEGEYAEALQNYDEAMRLEYQYG